MVDCFFGPRLANRREGGNGLEVAVREEEVLFAVSQEYLAAVREGCRKAEQEEQKDGRWHYNIIEVAHGL